MRSSVSKISGRSSSGMPMMSPMTDIGSTSATSSIQSPPPAASSPSIIAAARLRMPSSSLPMAFGVNACDITRRRLRRSGGSMLMIVGAEPMTPTPWMSGPSVAVNESVSRWMRWACRCLVAIQKSRLTVLATPSVSSWWNSGRSRRSSANSSSGKPFRHKVESDRSTGVVVGMQAPGLAVLDLECLK